MERVPRIDRQRPRLRFSGSSWLMLTPGSAGAGARCRRGPVGRRGDLAVADGLSEQDVDDLLATGERLGAVAAGGDLVAVGR